MKNKKLKNISEYINYNSDDRIIIKIIVKHDPDEDDYLYFKEDSIELSFQNNSFQIEYQDIQTVNLSMCSRLFNPGIIANNPAKWIVKRWTTGSVGTVMQPVVYCIDIDLVLQDTTIKIESNSINGILDMINLLKEKNIKVVDLLDIATILKNNPDKYYLFKYLDRIFPRMAKEHHLENPRGVRANK